MIGNSKTTDTTEEKAIKPETTPKERVQLELKELKDKILKLTAVLFGDNLMEKGISAEQLRLMEEQLKYMQGYAAILQNRLAHWDDHHNSFHHEFRTLTY